MRNSPLIYLATSALLISCATTTYAATNGQLPAFERTYATPFDTTWAAILHVLEEEEDKTQEVNKGAGIIRTYPTRHVFIFVPYYAQYDVRIVAQGNDASKVTLQAARFKRDMECRGCSRQIKLIPDTNLKRTKAIAEAFLSKLETELRVKPSTSIVIPNYKPAPVGGAPSKPSTASNVREDKESIAFIQQQLSALGYDPGPADGAAGRRTRDAIKAFQRDQGMPVDGAPTKELREALARAQGSPKTEQSAIQTAEEYRKAAKAGSPAAQAGLGLLYARGNGVPQDYGKAVEWFRKAAQSGNVTAQTSLGTLYREGKGVPQDYAKAVEWYEKAALQGNSNAQTNLGGMYELGMGVPQDVMVK